MWVRSWQLSGVKMIYDDALQTKREDIVSYIKMFTRTKPGCHQTIQKKKSYILLRQPGLNEIILDREQGANRTLVFSVE